MIGSILDTAEAHGEEPKMVPVVVTTEVEEPTRLEGYEAVDRYFDGELALSGIRINVW